MFVLALFAPFGCVTNVPQAEIDAAVEKALAEKGCLTAADVADHVTTADLDGYLTESTADARYAPAGDYASSDDVSALDTRVSAIEDDYLTSVEADAAYAPAPAAGESYATVTELDDAVNGVESWVRDQGYAAQSDLDAVGSLADAHDALFDYVTVDTSTHSVVFSGANVYVQNGDGSTDTTNAYGNLIIGYNADDGGRIRTGSHNLIVGDYNEWTSYGGIVTGTENSIADTYGAVLGGFNNNVMSGGSFGVVVGGSNNRATGDYSVVMGGDANEAVEGWSVVVGGYDNTTHGWYAALIGGTGSDARGDYSVIAGGEDNIANGQSSATLGGTNNVTRANDSYSVVLGGQSYETNTDWDIGPGAW